MDLLVKRSLDDLQSNDKGLQGEAFQNLMAATAEPVDWADEVWDELLSILRGKDNRGRAIAAQVLCSLAKSDPAKRMVADVHSLLEVTKDERFVTARHCLQSLWKIGVAGEDQRNVLIAGLEHRFKECAAEKNCTLIRYDILESLRKIYDVVGDEAIRQKASAWIETEDDLKYRKKYATLWRE